MKTEELLERLTGVKKQGAGWIASCPCKGNHKHGDSSPSLSISETNGKILVHCHLGCSAPEICAALNITVADLFTERTEEKNANPSIENFISYYAKQNELKYAEIYDYCYGEYNDGLCKVKFYDKSNKKTFRWIKKDKQTKSGYKMTHAGCLHRLYVAGDIERENVVFLVEGEKDANTIYQLLNTPAVCTEDGATKGDSGSKWRPEYTAQLTGKTVYLLWDNDEAGRNFANIEAEKLKDSAKQIYCVDIASAWPECPEKGDISDMLQSLGREAATDRLLKAIAEAEASQQGITATTTENLLDEFIKEIETEKYKPIETGIKAIDNQIGGGLMRQTLVLLGAEPGAGKTALAMMIFEKMAQGGNPCIYFNLEMSRNQLFARSLARIAWQSGNRNINAVQVMQGYKHTPEQRQAIIDAYYQYKRDIAPHIEFNPDNITSDLDDILNYINNVGERETAAGRPAPIVGIDYIHLLTSEKKEDNSEIIKRAVAGFKKYAKKYNSVVFCIMAQNRPANESTRASMSAGRDSSALEYSADLQLQIVKDEENDPQPGTPRSVTLYTTKNRFGAASVNYGAEFFFYGAQSVFIPKDTSRTEPAHSFNNNAFI